MIRGRFFRIFPDRCVIYRHLSGAIRSVKPSRVTVHRTGTTFVKDAFLIKHKTTGTKPVVSKCAFRSNTLIHSQAEQMEARNIMTIIKPITIPIIWIIIDPTPATLGININNSPSKPPTNRYASGWRKKHRLSCRNSRNKRQAPIAITA